MRLSDNYSSIVAVIKELLRDFNMPLIPVVTEDTIPYDGQILIKDGKIVKFKNNYYEYISNYYYNKEIINLTKNFVINSSSYDNYTHEYLGDYLRFLRDYKKIDLMSMYNCFNGDQPVRILKYDLDAMKINTSDRNYVYYMLPVKFNKTYTIAIDSACKYEICAMIYGNTFVESEKTDKLLEESYKIISSSSFNKPFLLNTNYKTTKDVWQYEKCLKLLIKLPRVVDSAITVLEGNYIEECNVVDGTLVTDFIQDDKSNNYFSRNSLLNYNGKISHQIADRLVEYLLGSAITSDEKIDNNISRVQSNIYWLTGIVGDEGIWNDDIKKKVYKQTLRQDILNGREPRYGNTIIGYDTRPREYKDTHFDTTCFIDKDVESLIEAWKDVDYYE